MRRELRVPQEVQTTAKWSKLTIVDGFMIIASIAVGFLTGWMVHPLLKYVYIAAFPIVTYILLLPSLDSPNRKNYQMIMIVLRKDRKVYHSLSESDINQLRKDREDEVI